MGNKPRVLLVDDQHGVIEMLSLFFTRAGFEVETAVDGQAALDTIAENQPDIVILDVMMPEMSGITVCRKLRSQPQTAKLPIIILSARSEVDDKLQGFEAGADDYVTKPVARQELLARAKALLHRAKFTTSLLGAQVIAFVGAKGGVGVTTVAINVAAALVAEEKSVTLVELQAHPGTMVHHLNMDPAQDLGDLLALEASELTWREVNRRVVQHKSGLRLLTAPQKSAEYNLSPDHARAIVDALMIKTDYLLLDIPTISGETSRLALEQADQIVLITEPEIVSIKAAQVKLSALREWSLSDRTRLVILSRTPSASMLRRDEVESALGLTPGSDGAISMIQPSPEAFQQAAQTGIPVIIDKPQISAARSLAELTKWLVEHEQDI